MEYIRAFDKLDSLPSTEDPMDAIGGRLADKVLTIERQDLALFLGGELLLVL